MRITKLLIACGLLILLPTSALALAVCERNVDTVEIHHINGMFTDNSAFNNNKLAIEEFLSTYFTGWDFDFDVSGTYNLSEPVFEQILQVARHKLQDANAATRLAIKQFLNDDPEYLNDPDGIAAVQDFLTDINAAYTGILAEDDARKAKASLVSLLDSCARVVLITHSQGNFYGNALFNDLYAGYVFPNGYSLAQYPMLGTIQIASPVYTPGGAAGTVYPEVVGHVTNNNDIVMTMIRYVLGGSVEANYNASYNSQDFTGHALELSYLKQPGQAEEIAGNLARIVFNLTPFPLHGQNAADSSAMQGYGYSGINRYLDIQFTSGAVYRYSEVPAMAFDGLHGASSQGSYFNEVVRNVYPFKKLE
ncbi:MAG: KTSC domain-containing protein [Desulfuromonadales bacterium]|nr:KTSC domain-containing protein [Desulfuromonadales bacterium]